MPLINASLPGASLPDISTFVIATDEPFLSVESYIVSYPVRIDDKHGIRVC